MRAYHLKRRAASLNWILERKKEKKRGGKKRKLQLTSSLQVGSPRNL